MVLGWREGERQREMGDGMERERKMELYSFIQSFIHLLSLL